MGSAEYNDLHQYTIATHSWTSLSGVVSGTPPPPRWEVQLAAHSNKLFVFGGRQGFQHVGTAQQFSMVMLASVCGACAFNRKLAGGISTLVLVK